MKKLKKFEAPIWFKDLYVQIKEEQDDLFEYFSEEIGYGPEWCKRNIGKCLQRLKPQERDWAGEQLNKIDIMMQYAWSRLYYENWNEIKDLIKVKSPEYNFKKKFIEFSGTTIFKEIKIRVQQVKDKIKNKITGS